MNHLKLISLPIALALGICSAWAHTDTIPSLKPLPFRHITTVPTMPDSADIILHQKKNFWRASVEVVGSNLSLWAFDRYALKGHYAYISWHTIKENFRHGFEWDNDHLHTNMFAHPYNGSVFFNAGRSNGFNFWQSELFAIGGSAMWEMFMEREYPSTNDIIATPIGGAALGEVLYRTSDLILDDRATGGERAGREIAAFLVDPMRGLTRIFSGAAWHHRSTSGREFGIPPVSVEISLGARYLRPWDDEEGSRIGATADIDIEYGDRFADRTKAPYDFFTFLLELQAMKSQPLLSRVEITGRLISKEIADKSDLNVNVGMYQHFDYFDSDTIRPQWGTYLECSVPYKLGTPASVGFGSMARYTGLKSMYLDGYLHINGVILGGILTDFYRNYNRNYNWGSGFSIKYGINWATADDRVSVKLAHQFYKLFVWNRSDKEFVWAYTPADGNPVYVKGDASQSSFNHLEGNISYRLHRQLYLTAGGDIYIRKTAYNDMTIKIDNTTIWHPIVESKQWSAHLMLTYKF